MGNFTTSSVERKAALLRSRKQFETNKPFKVSELMTALQLEGLTREDAEQVRAGLHSFTNKKTKAQDEQIKLIKKHLVKLENMGMGWYCWKDVGKTVTPIEPISKAKIKAKVEKPLPPVILSNKSRTVRRYYLFGFILIWESVQVG